MCPLSAWGKLMVSFILDFCIVTIGRGTHTSPPSALGKLLASFATSGSWVVGRRTEGVHICVLFLPGVSCWLPDFYTVISGRGAHTSPRSALLLAKWTAHSKVGAAKSHVIFLAHRMESFNSCDKLSKWTQKWCRSIQTFPSAPSKRKAE